MTNRFTRPVLIISALLCTVIICLLSPAQARDKFLDIHEYKTASGIPFWLVEDHSIPVIALDFAFDNAGAKHDSAKKQGLSRLASNTMDEGAGDLPAAEFQGALRRHSISLGFSSGRDTFGGSLKTRTTTKDKAAELLHLALTAPRFEKADVQRMIDANLARIRSSQSDPEWIAARLSNDIVFKDHPYALNSGGTLSTLPNINSADLKNFVTTRLTKNVLKIAIVGDITPADAKLYIDGIFGTLPQTQKITAEIPDFTIQNGGQTYLHNIDIPQSIVLGYLPALPRTDPDYYTYQVMNQILGAGGFGSRLTEEIREKRGLTYGIYSYLSQMEHTNFLTLSASTANESAHDMLALAKAEFAKMGTEPVSAEEREKAIAYINGSLPLTLSSTGNISSLILGMQLDNLPIDYLDQRADAFEAVTIEDIQSVAQKYLDTTNMTFIIVGQPKGFENDSITELTDIPNVN